MAKTEITAEEAAKKATGGKAPAANPGGTTPPADERDAKIIQLQDALSKASATNLELTTKLQAETETGLTASKRIADLEAEKTQHEAIIETLKATVKEATTAAPVRVLGNDPNIVEVDGAYYRAKQRAFWLPNAAESVPVKLETLTDEQKAVLVKNEHYFEALD